MQGLEPARGAGAYGALRRSIRQRKTSLCQLCVAPSSVARCAVKIRSRNFSLEVARCAV
ncbi:hypothetical protein A2U01_0063023, partial [Trifolium medium]|nr:hypothetical protein [Trifolium medium]